ncbi:hypothetical protein SADUNF_Sadunf13G0023700 [Salix dunnii]|uniref:Uncharacterized protein n=1 Tax=Salix dunnii TaxID=1413687 RepID=A0A835JK05_9ROSI|nr:hypothetical protein SADUNF_Sadunf13G0023700 [Salix dunnii]
MLITNMIELSVHTISVYSCCMVLLRFPCQHTLFLAKRTPCSLGVLTTLGEKILILGHCLTTISFNDGNLKKLVRLSNLTSSKYSSLLKMISSSVSSLSFVTISIIFLQERTVNFTSCTRLFAVEDDIKFNNPRQHNTSKIVKFSNEADDGARLTKLFRQQLSSIALYTSACTPVKFLGDGLFSSRNASFHSDSLLSFKAFATVTMARGKPAHLDAICNAMDWTSGSSTLPPAIFLNSSQASSSFKSRIGKFFSTSISLDKTSNSLDVSSILHSFCSSLNEIPIASKSSLFHRSSSTTRILFSCFNLSRSRPALPHSLSSLNFTSKRRLTIYTIQKFKKNATSNDLCFLPLSSRLDTKKKEPRENNFKLYKNQDESKQAKKFPFPIEIEYKENHKRTATSTTRRDKESELHTSNYKRKAAGMIHEDRVKSTDRNWKIDGMREWVAMNGKEAKRMQLVTTELTPMPNLSMAVVCCDERRPFLLCQYLMDEDVDKFLRQKGENSSSLHIKP